MSKHAAPAETALLVVRRTRTDADFYALLGPFLARREVVAAVGGPLWDDDGKVWSIALVQGAVVGFVGVTVRDRTATLASGYVAPSQAADAVWPTLLADATAYAATVSDRATATVSAAELPHYRRAGFRAERERGRYTVVARKVGA